MDLHIHSCGSHFKDGNIVSNLTVDNLPILVSKLNENNVNMCSITDHDNFEIDIYNKLKQEENKGTIKKVLPGVEFSVEIENKTIHVIVIFDDSIPDKLCNIQKFIFNGGQKPSYDSIDKQAFKQETFTNIIKNIGLNTVMIAHQKNTVTSKKARKNDVMSLGKDKFAELVFLDYFDAYEFKTASNEIFNKFYLSTNKDKITKKELKFITGTDCHNWENYSEDSKETLPAYLKCLPTFRGLSMAVTDYTRIKHVNSFFTQSSKILNNIELKIDNTKYNIELSKGINVIMGDNSIGKSLLIHKLTSYNYLDKKTLKSKYEKYLNNNKINICTEIPLSDIYAFDKQGSIREKFEDKKFNLMDNFKNKFPVAPNIEYHKSIVLKEIDRFIELLNYKNDYQNKLKDLKKFNIVIQEEENNSLYLKKIKINFLEEETNLKNILDQYSTLLITIEEIECNNTLEEEDRKQILEIKQKILDLEKKYKNKKLDLEFNKKKTNIINAVIDFKSKQLNQSKTDKDKTNQLFVNQKDTLISTITELIKLNKKITNFTPNIKKENLEITKNTVGNYNFISKCGIEEISNTYIEKKLKDPLKKNVKSLNLNDFNVTYLENAIANKDEQKDILQSYKEKILQSIEQDFKVENSIIGKDEKDLSKEMSSGFNSKIYFDILSSESETDGIYIIDQPEDDVSPVSIKKHLLNNFKEMSESRQIILITHNPQFIVNLDVDNIIFIYKTENDNKIKLEYGSLEFKNDNCNMLQLVSENIEGGIEIINERWKKYEKKLQL